MSAKKKRIMRTEEFQKLDNNLAVTIGGVKLTVGEIKDFFLKVAEQKNKEVRFDGRSKL